MSASQQSSQETSEQDGKSNAVRSLLPSFDPATDNIKEYVDKVRFLKEICPGKDRGMLAPRLAMLCKGTAWAQVKNLDPKQLTDPEKGVDALLKALSTWEESAELKTYEKVELALYKTTPRSDESTMSYVNRLSVAFDEISKMTIGEIKAFVLLRQSQLQAEDKRKVITMTNGILDAARIEQAMRSLNTSIISGVESKKKIYPVNFAQQEETEPVQGAEEAFVSTEAEETLVFDAFLSEVDEDALLVQQYEDALIETLQGDAEVSACLNTYLEARRRLSEKARVRGFWPKGRGKGKKGFGGKGRKPLAQRILESECRRCGKKGHWKAECPLRFQSSSSTPGPTASANLATTAPDSSAWEDVLFEMPADVTSLQANSCIMHVLCAEGSVSDFSSGFLGVPAAFSKKVLALEKIPARSQGPEQVSNPLSLVKSVVFQPELDQAFFVSHGSLGVVDSGASQNVMGASQLPEFLAEIPSEVRSQVKEGPCHITFKFGNSSTSTCQRAIYVPLGPAGKNSHRRRPDGVLIVKQLSEVPGGCSGFTIRTDILSQAAVRSAHHAVRGQALAA